MANGLSATAGVISPEGVEDERLGAFSAPGAGPDTGPCLAPRTDAHEDDGSQRMGDKFFRHHIDMTMMDRLVEPGKMANVV